MGRRVRIDGAEGADGPRGLFPRRGRRVGVQIQVRVRALMLVVLLAGVWLGLLLDPATGPPFGLVALAAGTTLAVLLAAMTLCWLGFGLFAVGDRVAAWARRAARGSGG